MNRYRVVFRVPVEVVVIAENVIEADQRANRWIDTLLPKLVGATEAWQSGSGQPMRIVEDNVDIADIEVTD